MGRRLIGCALGFAVACHHGDDDTASCGLASASPGDGAAHVSILAAPEVVFDGDPGSLGDDVLRLYEGDSARQVPATVTWDAGSLTLTATPERPLEHGATYRVEVDACGTDPLRFETTHNELLSYRNVDKKGRPTSCERYTVDDEGRPSGSVGSSGPGDDGDWCTDDDPFDRYVAEIYDGQAVDRVNYGDPGTDGIWFTDDDTVTDYSESLYGPPGLESSAYYDVGDDGEWFTNDDYARSGSIDTYEVGTDLLIRETNLGDPGPDGRIPTADDVPSNYRIVQSSPGAEHRVDYTDPGPNGVWYDDDDVADGEDGYTVGDGFADNLFYDAGPNGVWGDDDDRVTAVWHMVLDDRGLPLTWDINEDNGPDGIPATSDDTCDERYAYEVNDAGDTVRRTSQPSGPDHLCGTADDPPVDYVEEFDTTR